jgi:hypothetical protein
MSWQFTCLPHPMWTRSVAHQGGQGHPLHASQAPDSRLHNARHQLHVAKPLQQHTAAKGAQIWNSCATA